MARGKKSGGRLPGSLNLVTRELREAAQAYTETALEELARLAIHAESEAVRVAACRELLDRGHGRPALGITFESDLENGPLIVSWGPPIPPPQLDDRR